MRRALQLAYFFLVHHAARAALRSRVEIDFDPSTLTKPLLLVANHERRLDPFLLVLLPWHMVRQLVPLAFPTGTYFGRFHPIWPLLRLFGAYRLPRIAWHVEDYLRPTVSRLKRGYTILLYPEGRLGASPVRTAKRGVGYLVQHVDTTIIPIAVTGATSVSFRNVVTRRAVVSITVGAPLELGDVRSQEPEAVARAILAGVERLLPDDARGAAAV